MLALVNAAIPPVKFESAAQTFPEESVYWRPPAFMRIGEKLDGGVVAGANVMLACAVPFHDAVITADWLVRMVPATALKLADVDPAGMSTEVGTVKAGLLDERLICAPPDGADAEMLTAQVDEEDELIVWEEHCTEETVRDWLSAMLPPLAVTATEYPLASAATTLLSARGSEPLAGPAAVTVTTAITPLVIVF